MTDALDRLKTALADRYTIERELGQGGMATVYLAEDLRHHRKVALKVLRPEIAATLGAGRFAREVEVAARLQHPNILPLLDSGEADGFFFYVMPYVEGESLRDRLARGGELPIHDAVRILMEVADALSHAHAHGVVHRDIKPDNVMLSGRHALVADFGVAKAVTEATGRQVLTSAGVALGTPAYMAPEQATADPHQDHRVDIYALGVLGYELLTGRAPFSAATAQEMLAAHVTAEPEPLEQHRSTVSPALAAVVMKCLSKKPADRWQSADEVLAQLEPLATPSGGTTPTQTAPVEVLRSRRRIVTVAIGAGLIAFAAVVTLAFQLLRAKPLNVTVSEVAQVTNDPGVEFQPAISPDGKEVAYVAGPIGAPQLVIRGTANIAGAGSVRLSDTALGSAWLPTWSRNGRFVRFLGCPRGVVQPSSGGFRLPGSSADCSWSETDRLGGAVRGLSLPPRSQSVTWSSDGVWAAFLRGDTILAYSASDTVPRPVAVDTTFASELAPHSLTWSPDGRLIAYVYGNGGWDYNGNVAPSSIWIVAVAGGTPHRVTSDASLNVSPAWLDARHLLFVSNRDGPRGLYVVEVGSKGAQGDARVVPGISDPHSVSYSAGAGELAWAKFTLRQNIWSYPLGGAAPTSIRNGRPVTTGTQVIEQHDVSPDGRWIAYDANLRGKMDLYKMPLSGGAPEPLTETSQDEEGPRWSPDGREIAFYSWVSLDRTSVMVMDVGGGVSARLTSGPGYNAHPSWSPNGLEIAFTWNRSGDEYALWLLSRERIGGPWHQATQLSETECPFPDWAPDGGALACDGAGLSLISPRDGRVLRRDLAAANHLTRLYSNERYSRDGRTVFAAATGPDGRRGIWAIPVTGGRARLVIAFDDPALTSRGFFSVGRDRLYLTVSEYESDIWVAKLRW